MGKINSIKKGKAAEREVANLLKEHGFQARRGQQFSGSPDSPDVISSLPFHIEVKRTERLQLYKALEQAKADNSEKPSLIFHKQNRKPWVVVLEATEFLKLMKPTC